MKKLLILPLFVILLAISSSVTYAQTTAQPTDITPTLFCLGSCPQDTGSPTNTVVSPQPSSIAGTPTTAPCSNQTKNVTISAKHHKSISGGLLQQFLQFLLQLLQLLFQLPGNQIPPVATPTPTTSSPSSTPVSTPSPVPTAMLNPCPSPTVSSIPTAAISPTLIVTNFPSVTPNTPTPTIFASSPTPVSTQNQHWLITTSILSNLTALDANTAKHFFNTPNAFAMSTAGTPVSETAATGIRNYKSYAQFAQDIANGSIPTSVRWVLYDNEDWSFTPVNEGQHPAQYMKMFADLAHQHNLKVLEVPARDIVNVAGADCKANSGEGIDQAYIRCQIPADARYADIFEIQAQGDQSNITAYTNLVTNAVKQIRAVAPSITVMSGLTTDRGDTSTQIFDSWQASHTMVSGYWMNSTAATVSVADQALKMIQAAGD